MKSDPFAQLKLLDLQEVDSTLDHVAHRLENLPENAALAELAARRADVAAQQGQTSVEVDDLTRAQRKAEADVEQVVARRTRDQDRIDGGLVSDPRQLQAMQHEVQTLDRRISDLEDEELAVMESLEDAQGRLAALDAELAQIESDGAALLKARDQAVAELTATQADARAERDRLAGEIPDDLRALYDKLRAQQSGVGVGALSRGRCGGCQLDVGAADLARMSAAPPDEVLRCEECNRILVRTPESGI